MTDDIFEPPPPRLPPILRRLDQACLAAVIAVSLIAIAVFCTGLSPLGRGVIEIDQAEPLSAEFQVDINTADWPELTMLPNVGETLARRIVAWRTEQGRFIDHEDLLRIPGIGPKTLDAVRPFLRPISKTESMAGQ